MSADESTAPQDCVHCGAPIRSGARFCAACGKPTNPSEVATHALGEDIVPTRRRWRTAVPIAAAFALILGLLGLLSFYFQDRADEEERERGAIEQRVRALENEVESLTAQNSALGKRLRGAETRFKESSIGIAPLAQRVLRSVFTVEADFGAGSGFAAWRDGGATYALTAYHVVSGGDSVSLRRAGGEWQGEVVEVDETNDLAVVRVNDRIGPPLWQDVDATRSPVAGDELLLVGSPYGLEGSVTTGVVSRVTYNSIQTDAAANPGNSGGPALTRDGEVVGVLVAGGGQNVNFAIPIGRACVRLRSC
jgi:S1-C subfamily serine protease